MWLLNCLSYLIVLILSLYLLHLRNPWIYRSLPLAKIPGIPQAPHDLARRTILGSLPRDKAVEAIEAACPEGVDAGLLQLRVMGRNRVMLLSGKLIREILQQPDIFKKNVNFLLGRYVFGDGIFYANGDIWKKHRRGLARGFSPNQCLEVVWPAFKDFSSNYLIPSDVSSKTVHFNKIIGKAVFQIMCHFAFGVDYGIINEDYPDFKGNRIYKLVMQLFRALETPGLLTTSLGIPPAYLTFLPYYSKLKELRDEIHSHIQTIISSRLHEISQGLSVDRNDVLTKLLRNRDVDKEYNLKDVSEDLLSLIFAGFDTTANTISFTIGLLAQHPEKQAKARQELVDFLELNGEASLEKIRTLQNFKVSLPFLHACLLESWRMYPPASGLFLRVVAGQDVSLGGYHIPKGTGIITSVISHHHDKRVFGDDAATFRPERFLENEDLGSELLTFGAGITKCIASEFGSIQSLIGITSIIRQFEFSLSPDSNHRDHLVVRSRTAIIGPVQLYVRFERLHRDEIQEKV